MDPIVRTLRFIAMPFGYLAFVVALAAMSATAWLLGEQHELGFFSKRLAEAVSRYPEVTRRGVLVAWLTWAALLAIAVSPFDPLTTRWDEVVLAAVGFVALWRRLFADRRAER